MGTFSLAIQVGTPDGSRYEWFEALVDTGSSYTVLPTSALRAVGVSPDRTQLFEDADRQRTERDVGQTWIRVNDRAMVRAVVFGKEDAQPILGADTLQGLGFAVDPVSHRLLQVPGLLM